MRTSLKIYLAGGFKTNWQALVKARINGVEWLDPSLHGLSDPAAYTKWDLDAIRRCDVFFAYLESSNPGGYALALELGFASALGKHTILIDEHEGPSRLRYFEMVRTVADRRFSSVEDAVAYLKAHLESQMAGGWTIGDVAAR